MVTWCTTLLEDIPTGAHRPSVATLLMISPAGATGMAKM
jgi:hypothetical protein